MFATRRLTYLAGTGFSPAGINDLARPHSRYHGQIAETPILQHFRYTSEPDICFELNGYMSDFGKKANIEL